MNRSTLFNLATSTLLAAEVLAIVCAFLFNEIMRTLPDPYDSIYAERRANSIFTYLAIHCATTALLIFAAILSWGPLHRVCLALFLLLCIPWAVIVIATVRFLFLL